MEEQNKNGNIIAFRVDPYKKQLLQDQASKNNMKISEYCKNVLLDNLDQTMLLDSQKKLRELIIETVTDANEKQFYKILTMINKNNIGIETIILQNDMTYKYFDIPQTRSELNTHLVNHPITEVAREQVLKNIRELRSQKDNVDEQK
ncbi:MAG: hypothetical protein HFH31_00265 [Bacilli bacterium]|nr:hypothetical protein [Bacilli bacterium]